MPKRTKFHVNPTKCKWAYYRMRLNKISKHKNAIFQKCINIFSPNFAPYVLNKPTLISFW